MHDDVMELDLVKMKQYMDFLEFQCQKVKKMCEIMEADITIASYAMDELNGKLAVQRIQRNIVNISKNLPIYTDSYERLSEALKKLIILLGEGGK